MKRTVMSMAAVGALTASVFMLDSAVSAHPIQHSAKKLNIVGYSTPGPVYGTQTTPGTLEYAFAHTKPGAGTAFTNSFGASDSQSQLVASGLPADFVNFSYTTNIDSLVAKKLVPSNWYKGKYQGFVTDSVVAFGVRPGNPKHIKGWQSVTASGVRIVTPSTTASGSAKWNILGAYGYGRNVGRNRKAGLSYLRGLFKNIVSQPTSGSKTLAAFLSGIGDVMIVYEDDIMAGAAKNPGKIQLVVPPESMLIQNPAAVTQGSVSQNPGLARKFLAFLYTPQAQRIWAQSYYWPVVASVAKKYRFPKPKKLFTIRQFGGWTHADPEFFGANGFWVKIENGG